MSKFGMNVNQQSLRVDRQQAPVKELVDVTTEQQTTVVVMFPYICVSIQVGSLERPLMVCPSQRTSIAIAHQKLLPKRALTNPRADSPQYMASIDLRIASPKRLDDVRWLSNQQRFKQRQVHLAERKLRFGLETKRTALVGIYNA